MKNFKKLQKYICLLCFMATYNVLQTKINDVLYVLYILPWRNNFYWCITSTRKLPWFFDIDNIRRTTTLSWTKTQLYHSLFYFANIYSTLMHRLRRLTAWNICLSPFHSSAATNSRPPSSHPLAHPVVGEINIG